MAAKSARGESAVAKETHLLVFCHNEIEDSAGQVKTDDKYKIERFVYPQ